jgi:hypothetical protein
MSSVIAGLPPGTLQAVIRNNVTSRTDRKVSLPAVSLNFSFLIAVLHPATTPKPEEICLNVFMAVRFDLRYKVTAQSDAGQGYIYGIT